jgi:UDP-glucose 4-epimerase
MKKILIIGGSGFLGSHIADLLTKKKYHVTIFDKFKSNWLNDNQKMIVSDMGDSKKLENAIKNVDFVYHLAAMSDIGECMKNPIDSAETNILFTLKILEFCKKYKIKRLIYSSTIYIHSSQGGFYRVTKHASEQYIEEYNKRFSLNYTILRFGTIYGPRSKTNNNLTKIIDVALNKKILEYSGGTSEAIRKYINVKDAARLSCDILNKKFENKHILITGKKGVKITYVMNLVSKLLKIKSEPKYKKITKYGHYDVTPYSLKKTPEIKLYPKNFTNLKLGLIDLINELSK